MTYTAADARRKNDEELERRGFKHVNVPDICICGDVYFEWGED